MMTNPRSDTLEERFDRLYRDEHARLWRAVYAYSRNADVASDAVAEAFAQCLRRGDEVADPRAWLWRAAFAIARGSLAELARWVGVPPDQPDRSEPDLERLMAAVGRLSEKQRAVVLLRYYTGYRSGEIADMLGMAPTTVRVHLARGRRNLERALALEGDDDEEDRT